MDRSSDKQQAIDAACGVSVKSILCAKLHQRLCEIKLESPGVTIKELVAAAVELFVEEHEKKRGAFVETDLTKALNVSTGAPDTSQGRDEND